MSTPAGPLPAHLTADLPGMPTDYHGPHVATRALKPERIEWYRIHSTPEPGRVITHTCECKATIYELCNLGGAHYIRRTTRDPTPQTHESPKTIPKHAQHLWQQLLRGEAR